MDGKRERAEKKNQINSSHEIFKQKSCKYFLKIETKKE